MCTVVYSQPDFDSRSKFFLKKQIKVSESAAITLMLIVLNYLLFRKEQ